MENKTIAFIGGGNMAFSLIGGLIASNVPANHIRVADPDQEKLDALAARFGIRPFTNDNARAVDSADVVLLATKPQKLKEVAQEIALAIQHSRPLVLSVAAGVRETDIQNWLSSNDGNSENKLAIVRTMPNTPALLGCGATGLYANLHVSKEQKGLAESILRAVGITVWLEKEEQLDAVTAISGSGPAYFFLVMETMEKIGQQLGLPQETARILTLQTAFGAAKMALERPENSAELREKVTSPGGTTEQALQVFQQDQKLENLFAEALTAACNRSAELAELLGK